ncbi:MAG: hypothetical protein JW751_09030 [Polyangiaceae bacterium]|nr:hypothetical protein [Polyangiaceae bacterium]
MRTTIMKTTATTRRLLLALAAGFGLLAATETAQAQEILLTGPLAGAPAVRKLRLYRQGRLTIMPSATFTLLDHYQRTIIPGIQLDYNFTDWLSLGVWGGFAPDPLHLTAGLTEKIQQVNADRDCRNSAGDAEGPSATETDCRLTAVNMGSEFEEQLGEISWVAAPQITGVPFRGKVSLFKKIFIDTEMFFFLGAAFVGLKERVDCGPNSDSDLDACSGHEAFERKSRMTVGPTVGFGLTFWATQWLGIVPQYRLLPFAWNDGGFDTAGGDPDGDFPDSSITKEDRMYRFNQFFTIGFSIFLPTRYRISD